METPEDLERIRDFVMSNPIYLNSLVSSDAKMTAIAILPDTYSMQGEDETLTGFDSGGGVDLPAPVYLTDVEGDAVIAGLFEIIERFDAPDFRLHLAGALVMTYPSCQRSACTDHSNAPVS